MISQIIAFSLQQRLLIIGASVVLVIAGIISFERLPVQAFPDVQNVFVQVVTQYPGQAPEEVEKLIRAYSEIQRSVMCCQVEILV